MTELQGDYIALLPDNEGSMAVKLVVSKDFLKANHEGQIYMPRKLELIYKDFMKEAENGD